jgi:hypothetical protein
VVALKPIKSSQLEQQGYEPVSRTLAIRFKRSDKVYHFQDVPPEVAEGLEKSESPGKFFAASIRGKFAHTVMTQASESTEAA